MIENSDIRIQFENKNPLLWEQENPILFDGEIIFITTPDKQRFIKVGDGITPYNELPLQALVNVDHNGIGTMDGGVITEFNKGG